MELFEKQGSWYKLLENAIKQNLQGNHDMLTSQMPFMVSKILKCHFMVSKRVEAIKKKF